MRLGNKTMIMLVSKLSDIILFSLPSLRIALIIKTIKKTATQEIYQI